MLEKFIEAYSEKAYRFAFKLCGNEEEAKELVQEAFFRVMRKWETYDQSQPLETFYFTVLRNIYLDGAKSFERKTRVSLDMEVGGEEPSTLADSLADARDVALLDHIEREDGRARVRLAIDSLKPEHQAILTMADIECLSYDRIGKVMDCPPGTVRSRINRARNALKAKMLETMPKEVDDYVV